MFKYVFIEWMQILKEENITLNTFNSNSETFKLLLSISNSTVRLVFLS